MRRYSHTYVGLARPQMPPCPAALAPQTPLSAGYLLAERPDGGAMFGVADGHLFGKRGRAYDGANSFSNSGCLSNSRNRLITAGSGVASPRS
jgi:hypothetical protein